MTDKVSKDKEDNISRNTRLLERLSRYLYEDIDWNYSQLTRQEKSLISLEDFNYLKEKFQDRNKQS